MFDRVIDLLPQTTGIDGIAQAFQELSMVRQDGIRLAKTIKRGARLIVAPFHSCWLTVFTDHLFSDQVHDGLEEVVVDPHLVVQCIESQYLSNGVDAVIAQVCPHEGAVLLLDPGIVILVERAAAGDGDPLHDVTPEAQHMVIEELAPIVRVNLQHREGQAGQDVAKCVFHDQ